MNLPLGWLRRSPITVPLPWAAGTGIARLSTVGIDASLVYHLATTARTHGLQGRLCTLGVQDVRPTPDLVRGALAAAGLTDHLSRPSFYQQLGFAGVESIDVSDFEGCTHLFDLNTHGVPAMLTERFDAVYNGGTLEHIFDVRAGLRNVFELLRVGGIAIHAGPANGWVDHGFFQFSPTLLLDYYSANRFEILEARLIQTQGADPATVIVHSYTPGALDGRFQDDFGGQWLLYATFRKRGDSTWDAIPQQRLYTAMYGAPSDVTTAPRLRYAPPLVLDHGVPRRQAWQVSELPVPRHANGFEWVIEVPHLRHLADDGGRCSSPLVLFEDGEAIGPPHSMHDAIRRLGGGRYSHWSDCLRFSPSSNDDARTHVYTSACVDALTVNSGEPASA